MAYNYVVMCTYVAMLKGFVKLLNSKDVTCTNQINMLIIKPASAVLEKASLDIGPSPAEVLAVTKHS